MIRTFYEFLISRALDEGRPLSRWLARRVENDPRLRGFHRKTVALDAALRESVDVPASQQNRATLALAPRVPPTTLSQAKTSRRAVRLAQAAAAIAAALLLFAHWSHRQHQAAYAGQLQTLGGELAEFPPTMLQWLSNTAEASQRSVVYYGPFTRGSLPQISPWKSLPWDLQTHLQTPGWSVRSSTQRFEQPPTEREESEF